MTIGSCNPAVAHSDLTVNAGYLLPLMLRNIATGGLRFTDPADPGQVSLPRCIAAPPSYSRDQAGISQDYAYPALA